MTWPLKASISANPTLRHKAHLGRRQYLKQMVALSLGMHSPSWASRGNDAIRTSHTAGVDVGIWLAAQGSEPATQGVGWVDGQQQEHKLPAGFRGHGVAQHNQDPTRAVMLGRRPGPMGLEVNLAAPRISHKFECAPGFYFEGHACFAGPFQGGASLGVSATGNGPKHQRAPATLFATQTQRATGLGHLGLYNANNYQPQGQFSSYGIEPHEVLLMPDGHTLVVANGGLRYSTNEVDNSTSPANLATMAPNLSYIDARTGALLEQAIFEQATAVADDYVASPEPSANQRTPALTELPKSLLSKASIRHIAVAGDGTVAIAMQLQRQAIADNTLVPLAAIHRRGQAIQALAAPASLVASLEDYLGSVAINDTTGIAGFTSPRGNVVLFWRLATGVFAGYHRMHDVCGIAVTPCHSFFVLTNSAGLTHHIHAHTLQHHPKRDARFTLRWDNHLTIFPSIPQEPQVCL